MRDDVAADGVGRSANEKPLALQAALLALEVALTVAVMLVAVWLVREHAIDWYVVPSGSMEETIHIGDKLIGDKWWWRVDGIKRGDVMTFDGDDGDILVKRVIGLPGEVVEIDDGLVFIDGDAISEPYAKGETFDGEVADPILLGEDEYFMLGDNRENSADSRYRGPVREDEMLARVVWIV